MRTFLKATTLLLSLLLLAACGDDDPSRPGFAGPDLSGSWAGQWRDSAVTMVLTQSGADVTGTLTWGRESYELDGSVSEAGIFEWSGATADPSDCVGMGSTRDHFQVMAQASEMIGLAIRGERTGEGDDPCGGRSFVQQGEMRLERAF